MAELLKKRRSFAAVVKTYRRLAINRPASSTFDFLTVAGTVFREVEDLTILQLDELDDAIDWKFLLLAHAYPA